MIIIVDIQEGYNFIVVKMLPRSKVSWRNNPRPKRRLSDEEYKQRLIDSNSPYESLEEYIDSKTKILHRCKVCGYEHYIKPFNALKSKVCPKCQANNTRDRSRKTHEQFLEEFNKIDSNLEILGEYVNAKTKIKCRCKLCNRIIEKYPDHILDGSSCKSCSSKKANESRIISHNEFIEKIKELVNPTIEIVGQYKNSKTKIKCICKICDKSFYLSPASIKNGYGHKECSHISRGINSRINPEDFSKTILSINPNIMLLELYAKSDEKILCKCLICNHEWKAWPMNLKKGVGCPECAEIQRRITQYNFHKDKYHRFIESINSVELLEEYIDADTPILHLCLICNNSWKIDPQHSMRSRCLCPVCYSSKGEKAILDFLNNHNISYKWQKYFDDLFGVGNGLLSYDFYLPTNNLLIEFQGQQHEHPIDYFGGEEQFKIQQEHDRRKREYAKEHNINLLEIWYYDYDNIEEILTNYLNLETVETVEVA